MSGPSVCERVQCVLVDEIDRLRLALRRESFEHVQTREALEATRETLEKTRFDYRQLSEHDEAKAVVIRRLREEIERVAELERALDDAREKLEALEKERELANKKGGEA